MNAINLNDFTAKEQKQLKDNLIEMPRGDLRERRFAVDSEIQERITEIIISCKKSRNDTEYLFQKILTNGDITFEEGYYYFKILPIDTNNLKMETEYLYDIEISGTNLKTTTLGLLRLTTEITINE